jgi:hypothetical protein
MFVYTRIYTYVYILYIYVYIYIHIIYTVYIYIRVYIHVHKVKYITYIHVSRVFLPATAALRGAAVVAEVKSARSPANLIN